MTEIRLLLSAAQALALLRLVLVLIAFLVGFEAGLGALSQAIRDPLSLALFVRSSFRVGLGLGFGSLLCLLALDLGVFGSVPRL